MKEKRGAASKSKTGTKRRRCFVNCSTEGKAVKDVN